jgi:hypothetical protein
MRLLFYFQISDFYVSMFQISMFHISMFVRLRQEAVGERLSERERGVERGRDPGREDARRHPAVRAAAVQAAGAHMPGANPTTSQFTYNNNGALLKARAFLKLKKLFSLDQSVF